MDYSFTMSDIELNGNAIQLLACPVFGRTAYTCA